MDPQLEPIIKKAREILSIKGVKGIGKAAMCKACAITPEEFENLIGTEADLVDKILEHERKSFNNIFDEYDFDGMNAIDILIIVSLEVSKRFKFVNPAITFELQTCYPEIYKKNFDDKVEFVFQKIQINLQKGISQGMYRDDFSIELVSRHYMSKYIEFHNPESYPPEEFSFAMLFDIMFDSFIRGIANKEGIEYYEQRRQLYATINFNR
ncbi:MAG: hypothetical protein V2A54_04980 [Bacteroidota bacterium]